MCLQWKLCIHTAWRKQNSSFNLQALDAFDYLIIGGATVVWAALVQTIWHFHLFERFLRLEWKRETWVRIPPDVTSTRLL